MKKTDEKECLLDLYTTCSLYSAYFILNPKTTYYCANTQLVILFFVKKYLLESFDLTGQLDVVCILYRSL